MDQPTDLGGRGRMFVDLLTALDCAMHEVAHIFPAVDHRSRLPARPTDAELDRIASSLRTTTSAELRDAFECWRRRDEEFLDAVRRLGHLREQESKPDASYQSELARRIDDVRERRALVGEAGEDLRRRVALDLDAALTRPPVTGTHGSTKASGSVGQPGSRMPAAAPTDETEATDDVDIGEIALLGDPENLDVVDELDGRWAPGEPAPGIPADEVLQVHALTETEPSADQLGIPDEAFDLPAPDEEEPVEQPEASSEETRARTPLLGGTLEIRYEEWDEPDTA